MTTPPRSGKRPQLLQQPRHIFVFIGERRAACNDQKCVRRQVEMFSAQRLVLRFKHCRVDSGRNYSHPATSFGDWAARRRFQPASDCLRPCGLHNSDMRAIFANAQPLPEIGLQAISRSGMDGKGLSAWRSDRIHDKESSLQSHATYRGR